MNKLERMASVERIDYSKCYTNISFEINFDYITRKTTAALTEPKALNTKKGPTTDNSFYGNTNLIRARENRDEKNKQNETENRTEQNCLKICDSKEKR